MKKYHFSSDNVCKYMSPDFSLGDINKDFSNVNKIELFGVKSKIVTDLSIYTKIDTMSCLKNKVRGKEKIGEGKYGVVVNACMKKDCDTDFALKTISTELNVNNYMSFWNEVFVQTYFAFTGYAPRIISAWTCLDIHKNKLNGYIIMEKITAIKVTKKSVTANIKRIEDAIYALFTTMVVHNDLHDENILITARGKIQIIDFGKALVFYTDGTMLPRYENSVARSTYISNVFLTDFDKMNYIIMWLIYVTNDILMISKTGLSGYVRKNKHQLEVTRKIDVIDLLRQIKTATVSK